MEFWIARSENGYIRLYPKKPHKELSMLSMSTYWTDNLKSYKIDDELFPEVTFENSPQKVKLELVKEE